MLKRSGIVWKLSAVFITIILCILVASGFMNAWIEDRNAISSAREASLAHSQTVLCNFRSVMMTGDLDCIHGMLQSLVTENPVYDDIRLVAHGDGRVIVSSGKVQKEGEALNILEDRNIQDNQGNIQDNQGREESWNIEDNRVKPYDQSHRSCQSCHEIDDPATRLGTGPFDEIMDLSDNGRILSVTTPLLNEAGCRNAACHAHAASPDLLGLLETDFSLAHVDAMGTNRTLRTLGIIVIAVLLSFGLARYFLSRYLNRPVQGLIEGMDMLAEKQFDFRLDEDRNDEFGELAISFNDMASMLSASLRELKKSREYLQGILESSADVIITVNASGRIQTINSGTENTLGYRREEVVGQSIEIFYADHHDRLLAAEKLKHSDNVLNFETRFLTSSGEARDMLLTLSRLRNPQGAVIGTIGIGKDITQEKQLQKQLIQSQRLAAIGQVFTGIQHSMKNMLNACKGGAFMVKTGLAKDNRKMLEEGWDMVQQGISRMTDMSMDMLKYVKEWKPKLAVTDLKPTLSEIDAVIRQTANDKGIDFHLHLPESLPEVVCDARMMHTAVMDIVSNAIDACFWKEYEEDEKPRVEVRPYIEDGSIEDGGTKDKEIEISGDRFVIEISDNGCGMTDEIKTNIFTPFFSTKSKAGTGLGLSITSRIIGVHDGKIDVDSIPDHGTTFRIVIPVQGPGNHKESIDGEKSTSSR